MTFVLQRPRVDVDINIKAYNKDGYIRDVESGAVTHRFTSVRIYTESIDTQTGIIRAMDGEGDNYGYAIGPARYTGYVDILANDPKTGLLLRECIELNALCTLNIYEKYPESGASEPIVLDDVIFTNDDFTINDTFTDVPAIRYSFTALSITRNGDTYGDGWENAPSGAAPDDSVW